MKVKSYLDRNILKADTGDILEYPDNSKEKIIFKCKDLVCKSYFLEQIQTINIKKNGQTGRIRTWLKFKTYKK